MDEIKHLKDYVLKKVGVKPMMEASNTTDYDYAKHLPQPCSWIKKNKLTNTWECCLSREDKNMKTEDKDYSKCKKCTENERRSGECNYVWDVNFYKGDPSVEVKNYDSEGAKQRKMVKSNFEFSKISDFPDFPSKSPNKRLGPKSSFDPMLAKTEPHRTVDFGNCEFLS